MIPTNDKQMLENYIRYRNDPWPFLTECCYTLDQVDTLNPIKLFPNKDYLKLFVRIWQREKLLLVPKSRRMTMSWTLICLHVWDVIFHKGKFLAFVSKKEEDAGELVDRATFIIEHIPSDKIHPSLLPKWEPRAKPPALSFHDIHSKIQGFPMTANQLRQFTFSRILGDETAFWPDAADFYSSAKPTLDGGGAMCLVSSASPGFFQRLVYDTLDNDEDADREEPPEGAKVLYPMTGVRIWKNPKNKFCVFDLDMTADPAKRDEAYEEAIRASMPREKFLQEYKRKWIVFLGKPVYPDYSETLHTTHTEIKPMAGLPLLLGWDFGLTPACIVGQLVGDQLRILREYTAQAQPIITFAPEVMSQLRIHYSEWNDHERDFRHFIDPAGFKRAETDARTCAQIMQEYAKIKKIFPGAPMDNNWESRKAAVERRLLTRTSKGPAILIAKKTTPTLSKGFAGGYQYPDITQTTARGDQVRPIKNNYSHPHDALQYLCWGIQHSPEMSKHYNIPTPRYQQLGKDSHAKHDK